LLNEAHNILRIFRACNFCYSVYAEVTCAFAITGNKCVSPVKIVEISQWHRTKKQFRTGRSFFASSSYCKEFIVVVVAIHWPDYDNEIHRLINI